MRTRILLAAMVALLAAGSLAAAEADFDEKRTERPPVGDEKLRQELLDRKEKDQAMRKQAIGRKFEDAELQKMIEVDRDNTAWLKGVIERHGWPDEALVGKDGAFAAWLLVQHADLDLAFQKKCLGLMEKAVEKNDASPRELAYLTDRVRVAEKKPQVYGTQFELVDGKLRPKPIEDEQHVDDRHKKVGLPLLAEYLKSAEAAYAPAKEQP